MEENKFKGLKIEYHILQSFPVVCLNRDDVGSPKTAVVGGVKRARVSSQCWKRQVRLALHDEGIQLAVRTKHLEEMIANYFSDEEKIQYEEKLAVVVKAISDDTLVFFSENEAKAIADFIRGMDGNAVENSGDKKKAKLSKSAEKELNKTVGKVRKENKGLDGLDIALFGRMVAKATVLNSEAAASFSHAITTHKVSSEIDYFTALDDLSEEDESGSSHIGANEFNSGTYYRYVSLNLGMLYDYIGDVEGVKKAVDAFTKALFVAVPQARQKTQAGYCPWDYAHVYVRKGQEVQLSFETPVKATNSGYLEASKKTMEENLQRNEKLMGSLFGKVDEFVYGDSDEHGIDQLVEKLRADIDEIGR